jgi:hypothetical protein
MNETEQTVQARSPRRRLMWAAISVALVAALGALGLSIYNTARFDDRVQDYIQGHRASLAGAQGPQGPRGPVGPQGPAGLPGLRGPAGADGEQVDLSSYSSCLEFELEQWMNGASASTTVSSITGRVSTDIDVPLLFLSCP